MKLVSILGGVIGVATIVWGVVKVSKVREEAENAANDAIDEIEKKNTIIDTANTFDDADAVTTCVDILMYAKNRIKNAKTEKKVYDYIHEFDRMVDNLTTDDNDVNLAYLEYYSNDVNDKREKDERNARDEATEKIIFTAGSAVSRVVKEFTRWSNRYHAHPISRPVDKAYGTAERMIRRGVEWTDVFHNPYRYF